MELRRIPIKRIKPSPYNPRKALRPDDAAYGQLLRSMDEFGYVSPIIWNQRTGHIVGGHQRYAVLVAQGTKHIEVVVVDFPPEKEKAACIALNKISGEWDQEKLASLLDELVKTPDLDVALTGFDLTEVSQITAGLGRGSVSEPETFDLDAELAAERPVVSRPGDIIELGDHRILCGDATKKKDITRLMGDRRARLLWSDAPYNVAYSGDNRPKSPDANKKGRKWKKICADDQSPAKYSAWFKKFVEAVKDALAPGCAYYLFNGHANFGLMHETLCASDMKPSCVITWAKESPSPTFGDYNEATEFCLYGWKRGAKRAWYGPKNECTLWNIHRDWTHAYHHPTQKALEFAERAIRNSSKIGEIVLDPFLGGGTALIAAARLGRICYGIEIEPRYVDVIVRRFIALAGKSAVSAEVAARYHLTD